MFVPELAAGTSDHKPVIDVRPVGAELSAPNCREPAVRPTSLRRCCSKTGTASNRTDAAPDTQKTKVGIRLS